MRAFLLAYGGRLAGYFLWFLILGVSVRSYLAQDAPPPDVDESTEVGALVSVQGEVNLREPDGLFWRSARSGALVYERWTISTGSDSSAEVLLTDGRRLQIGEKALLALDHRNAAQESGFLVQVLKGGVRVQAAPAVANAGESSFGLARLLESKSLRRAAGLLSRLGVESATRALPHPVLVKAGNTALRADAKATDFALSLKLGESTPQVNVLKGLVQAAAMPRGAGGAHARDGGGVLGELALKARDLKTIDPAGTGWQAESLPEADLREVIVLTPAPPSVPGAPPPENPLAALSASATAAPSPSTSAVAAATAKTPTPPPVSLRPPRLASLRAGDIIWTDRPLQGASAPSLVVGARGTDPTADQRLLLWLGEGDARGRLEAPKAGASYAFVLPGKLVDSKAAPVRRAEDGLPERLLTIRVGARGAEETKSSGEKADASESAPVTSDETVVHLRSVRDLGARSVEVTVPPERLLHAERGGSSSGASDTLPVYVASNAREDDKSDAGSAEGTDKKKEAGSREKDETGWRVTLERGDSLVRLSHALGHVPEFSLAGDANAEPGARHGEGEPEGRRQAATRRVWLAGPHALVASLDASTPLVPAAFRALARALGAGVAFEGRGTAFLCASDACASSRLREARDVHYFETQDGDEKRNEAGEKESTGPSHPGLVGVRTRLLVAEPTALKLALAHSSALFAEQVRPLRLSTSGARSGGASGDARTDATDVPSTWSSEARADLGRAKANGALRERLIVVRSFSKKSIDPVTVADGSGGGGGAEAARAGGGDVLVDILDASHVKQCFGFSEPPQGLVKKQTYDAVDIFQDLRLNCGAAYLIVAPQKDGADWTLVSASDRDSAPFSTVHKRAPGLSRSAILDWLAAATARDGVVVSERGALVTVVSVNGHAPSADKTEAVVFPRRPTASEGGGRVTEILERVATSGAFTLYRRLFHESAPAGDAAQGAGVRVY